MKHICLFILFLSLAMLNAINVEYTNSTERNRFNPTRIDGVEYISISELRQILKTGNHQIDYQHNKLTFSIFSESVIVYLNTNFVSSRGRLSNLSYPIVQQRGDFYLPTTFISHSLVDFFPDKFEWNSTTKTIKTELPRDRRIRRIILDPGHGGRDPGAVGRRYQEKNIVLEIARRLKTELEKELDVEVLLTRSSDDFVSLQDRTKFANQNNGDLFISLHANGHRNRTAQGIEVYFLSAARTDEERAIEALENSVVFEFEGGGDAVKAYDDLQFILADMLQSVQLEESSDLAIRLQTELVRKTNAANRGVKQAGFYVLRGVFMPAVLIEVGFISNEAEETKLMTRSYQDQIINALVDGIRSFKIKYDNLW
jgi:N-acetylmuramoyl-L-alanine amidase